MSDTPETDESFSSVQRNGLSPIIAYVYRDDMKKMEIERDHAMLEISLMDQSFETIRKIIEKGGGTKDVIAFLDTPRA